MPDYINREKEIKSWEKAIEIAPDERYPVDEIIRSLKNAPSVDAVEVVRCKDCKLRKEIDVLGIHNIVCNRFNEIDVYFVVDGNDYCKWGEKE